MKGDSTVKVTYFHYVNHRLRPCEKPDVHETAEAICKRPGTGDPALHPKQDELPCPGVSGLRGDNKKPRR